MVSFSNSFMENTQLYNETKDAFSYVTFGGYNSSQIVNGDGGLVNLPLASEKLNPTSFWGVKGKGFAYGNTTVMHPNNKTILAIIDSGTTLIMLPQTYYELAMNTLSTQLKNDTSVDMLCKRIKTTNQLDMCYFNNTDCKTISPKLKSWKWYFGKFVFELESKAILKDGSDKEHNCKVCTIHMRGDKRDPKDEQRFLMGNVFLKNFYSVYDYDSQSVRLGVNIHSKDFAKIYEYDSELWKNYTSAPEKGAKSTVKPKIEKPQQPTKQQPETQKLATNVQPGGTEELRPLMMQVDNGKSWAWKVTLRQSGSA